MVHFGVYLWGRNKKSRHRSVVVKSTKYYYKEKFVLNEN
jgi:hypothetical protein